MLGVKALKKRSFVPSAKRATLLRVIVLKKQSDLSGKLRHILFCAKNMNQYTDNLYIQPIHDLLGFN